MASLATRYIADGFLPRLPPALDKEKLLSPICEEPTREELTFSSREELFNLFEYKGELPGGIDSTEAKLGVVGSILNSRVRDVFEKHLGYSGKLVIKKNYKVKSVGDGRGVSLVFGKDFPYLVKIFALGVFDPTTNTYSLVFNSEDLKPEDQVLFELQERFETDLYKQMRRYYSGPYMLYQIASQVGRALVDNEENHLSHRDVKPENILVGVDGDVRLCDFGFYTRIEGDVEAKKDFKGTLKYLPPEIYFGLKYIQEGTRKTTAGHEYYLSSDWFSLGCVLFGMATGVNLISSTDYSREKSDSVSSWRKNMKIFIKNYPQMVRERTLCSVRCQSLDGGYFHIEAPILVDLFPDIRKRDAFIDFVISILNPDPLKRLHGGLAMSHPYIVDDGKSSVLEFQQWLRV
jgi:serine/threonine protein kinase